VAVGAVEACRRNTARAAAASAVLRHLGNRGLEGRGFRDVRGAEPDTAVQLGPVRVRAVPAAFRVARYPGDERSRSRPRPPRLPVWLFRG
jgi:hypothetical protein